ncbi:MAG: UvrD-helicase domain-containing protein, partial [Noviherbaspirillum sp.]
SDPARDDCGILCDWPQDADAPTHFSCFGRKQERGAARDALFAAEESFKQQEDWNLLYVAATRAKEILIVSGVAGARGALPDGANEGSWYHRLQSVPETIFEAASQEWENTLAPETNGEFSIPIFDPPLMPGPGVRAQQASNAAIEEGLALHALLERLTQTQNWPVVVPEVAQLVRWLRCPPATAAAIHAQAMRILSQPQLERFFNPARFHFARNELEVMIGNQMLRFDRAVVYEDEVWILDYKRDLLNSERADYEAQLAGYRAAAQQVFSGKAIRTALVTADGALWEME